MLKSGRDLDRVSSVHKAAAPEEAAAEAPAAEEAAAGEEKVIMRKICFLFATPTTPS